MSNVNLDAMITQSLYNLASSSFRYLELRTGKQPKTCEHRNRSRLLCRIPFENGSIQNKYALVLEKGIVGHFRITGKRRKVMVQGSVGTTPESDFRMDHTSIEAGQQIWITNFKLNFG